MKNLRGYRQVNNVFGEGTSPKMRNLRTAIGTLGFNSEDVMKHKQERLFLCSAKPKIQTTPDEQTSEKCN